MGLGHWQTGTGTPIPALDGCIDISATPFTNTLPLQRLTWTINASADIRVVYLEVPALTMLPELERYPCLQDTGSTGLYDFEALSVDFRVNLPVDTQKLVLDYPDLFKRVHFNH
jgi:uncharacterized protein